MICVTGCGYDSHHRNPCDIEHKEGLSEYLLLIVKTPAWVFINNQRIFTKPNMVILFDQNTYIHYGCDTPNYNDDWIHFYLEKDSSDISLSSLQLPFNQPLYPPDIPRLSRFIQMITQEYRFPAKHSKQILHCLTFAFLSALTEDLMRSNPLIFQHKYYRALLNIRTALYNNPANLWTISDMAHSVNLSVSYFQHLYKQFFSTSAQTDKIHARLELAKFYLSHSDMNICTISSFCGYENEIHFMRQFKKFEGITPSDFRKKAPGK